MVADRLPPPAAREVEDRIMDFVRRELLSPEVNVDREDDLLSGDLLDSVAVLRLAAFVEEEFEFKIQPADFVIENFQNVAVLADYVQ
ncbi:MAG: phosphopantetheine-binding protein, partial [Acidobacteriota bacterium]|nr:phosphopantetheine-binding protein [Acidobacteriota bacterium]